MHALARGIARRPVVAGADAVLANVEVLGVVDVLVRARLDAVDYLHIYFSIFSEQTKKKETTKMPLPLECWIPPHG